MGSAVADEGSDDVAAWGEQWLQAFVEAAPNDDERKTREWVAGNFRSLTLEELMQWWVRHPNPMSNDMHDAERAAYDHLTLYFRERVGLLVWRAYREYRRRGLAIPEVVLAAFDGWAVRLETASGHREIAEAIEMTDGGSGAQGAAYLGRLERPREIASDVALYLRMWGKGKPIREAYAWTAKRHKTTESNVKQIYLRWVKKDRLPRR